jgi:hypothetical protein
MKITLEAFQNNFDQRNICGRLKVIGILIVVQGCFTKFCCSFSLAIVALQPNITSSMSGNQGRIKHRENTVSNTFLSLIP